MSDGLTVEAESSSPPHPIPRQKRTPPQKALRHSKRDIHTFTCKEQLLDLTEATTQRDIEVLERDGREVPGPRNNLVSLEECARNMG